MGASRRESWSASVMILKHAQEYRLVTDIDERGLVEVVQSVNESLIATKFRNKGFHILRHKT